MGHLVEENILARKAISQKAQPKEDVQEDAVTRELVPGHQSLMDPCEQRAKTNHHLHPLPQLWHPLMLSPQFLLPASAPPVTASAPEP